MPVLIRMNMKQVKADTLKATGKDGKKVVVNWKVVIVSSLLVLLTGCSVKFEVGYHGKTGRDDQTVTSDFKTPAKSSRY